MKKKDDTLMYHAIMVYLFCILLFIMGVYILGTQLWNWIFHKQILIVQLGLGLWLIAICIIGMFLDFIITYTTFLKRLKRGYYRNDI